MRITLGSILEKVKEWVSLLFISDHEMCSFPFRYSFLSSIPVIPEGQGDDGFVYQQLKLSPRHQGPTNWQPARQKKQGTVELHCPSSHSLCATLSIDTHVDSLAADSQ